MREIAEAAIGDPSLLRDGLTQRERIAIETYRDARAALSLIREAVEDCAPPGSVPREEYLTPESPSRQRRWSAASMPLPVGADTVARNAREKSELCEIDMMTKTSRTNLWGQFLPGEGLD
jgi:hypothetical protein